MSPITFKHLRKNSKSSLLSTSKLACRCVYILCYIYVWWCHQFPEFHALRVVLSQTKGSQSSQRATLSENKTMFPQLAWSCVYFVLHLCVMPSVSMLTKEKLKSDRIVRERHYRRIRQCCPSRGGTLCSEAHVKHYHCYSHVFDFLNHIYQNLTLYVF